MVDTGRADIRPTVSSPRQRFLARCEEVESLYEDAEVVRVPVGPGPVEVGTGFDWLTAAQDGICWLESEAAAGRTVVVRYMPRSGEVTGYRLRSGDVGSSLHAYGGLPYLFRSTGDLVAVEAATSQVIGRAGRTASGHAYGDLASFGGDMLCVRESDDGDEMIVLPAGSLGPRVLLAAAGFLASPRAHSGRLAWMQWAWDVMPWDSSEIWVADLTAAGKLAAPRRVAGGRAESAIQPCWAADGSLYFLSDRSGWWNLYRWRNGETVPVAPMEAECGTAPWESGYSNFVLLANDRIAMTVQSGPEQHLVIIESSEARRTVRLPYTSFKPFVVQVGGRVGLIGASPTRFPEVALVSTDGSDAVQVIRRTVARTAPRGVSVPQVLTVSGEGATTAVLFYPPTGGSADPPPLIVRPHAGPTYHNELRLNDEVQFFTGRGFAVAEVDYRGSTGYGRRFRAALDGNWGRYDVQDCRATAQWLAATGRVDPRALFISGASAGGYTALKAVCGHGPFALAVARSAIVDPHRWQTTAPRFQRPHAAVLASATSPVQAAEVTRPVLLVHGVDDRVAPVTDVDHLAAALRERGALVDLLRFDGVGHYLSAATREVALEAELAAYRQVLRERRIVIPTTG